MLQTPDLRIEVQYFDVPGGKVGSTRMSLSELVAWLTDNPGYVIHTLRDMS